MILLKFYIRLCTLMPISRKCEVQDTCVQAVQGRWGLWRREENGSGPWWSQAKCRSGYVFHMAFRAKTRPASPDPGHGSAKQASGADFHS